MNYHADLLNAVLRSDLSSFIHKSFNTIVPGSEFLPNWHIQAIAWHLLEVARGNIKRLLITIPPRNLKSTCASVAFPAWLLGNDPTRRIVCVSYSADLARKHSTDCRAVMQSSWYPQVFPRTRIDPDKNTELEFKTTRGGYRFSTSVGGTLTGRGGNLFIIDDPLKADEADSEVARTSGNNWYDNTLYSRLDNKNDDAIVIIMQRLHVGDLIAHVLEQEPWVHLTIPAIAEAPQQLVYGNGLIHERHIGDVLHPSRESREAIESARRALGTYAFAAQYQQEPVPPGGGMIKLDWFRRYEAAPSRTGSDQIVQSWDTASKADQINDYSVCSTWLVRKNDYFLIDVYRDRLEYPALKRRAVELAQRHRPDAILIEDKGSGTQLIQDLHASGSLHPIGVQPEGDKIVRMSNQSAKIEAGQVWLPRSAHWLQEFETEVMRFHKGRFDDQIDSLSQFLRWITDRTPIQIFV